MIQEDPIPDIRSANLYPSEASVEYTDAYGERTVLGGCMRQAWLRVKMMESLARTRESRFCLPIGENDIIVQPTPYTAKTMWVFEAGNKYESMVKEKMLASGILAASHKRFFRNIKYGYVLSGELDAVGKDPRTGEFFGVEVKSIYGFNAEKEVIGNTGERRAGRKGQPKPQNVMQAAIYDFVWPELPYFKLMYIMRDKVLKTEFDISVEQDTGRIYVDGDPIKEYTLFDVFSRFSNLALALHTSKLPPRDYDLQYNDEKMNKLIARNKMAKTNSEKWEKYWDRTQEIAETGKGRPLMRPELGDWQCFAPGTLVRMANGTFKTIETIAIGDSVSGYDGSTKVVRVESKPGSISSRIKPRGMLDTVCTADHKWLVAQWPTTSKRYKPDAFIPKLMSVNTMSSLDKETCDKTALLLPVHDGSFTGKELSVDECKLLGYFAAEGNLGNTQRSVYYQVQFTIHPEEHEIAQDIISLGTRLFNCNFSDKIIEDTRPGHEAWTSRRIVFYSVKMANFIRSHVFGRRAHTKTLSPSIMGSSQEATEAFLEAAWLGDGYEEDNRRGISTSSRILCNQYQQLYWRLGIPAIAQYANKSKEAFEHQCRQGYRVQYEGDSGHAIKFVNIGNRKFAAMAISSIHGVDLPEKVWDIEVESDYHVFTTESGLASNCSYCKFQNFCYDSNGNHNDFNLMGI